MKYCRLFALLLVLSMVLSIAHPGAKALSSDEIQTQIQDLEKQNEEIEAELAELEQQTLDNYSEMEQVVRQKGLID